MIRAKMRFTDVQVHTGGDPSIHPPGTASGYLAYERLLMLDEVANLDGVSNISEIRASKPALQ